MASKVVYVINHVAFFVSHRLPLALGAIERGFEASLITGRAGSDSMEIAAEQDLHKHRIQHSRVDFTAAGINPFAEFRGLLQVIRAMRRERPDIVHCASPKGILHGAIAARITRTPSVVLAVSGMGFAYASDSRSSLLRSWIGFIYRMVARYAYGHPNKRVIVQNSGDRELIVKLGLASEHEVVLIPGSGVDVRRLSGSDIGQKSQIVLFAARMVAEKGVREFIEAARIVRRSLPQWRFVMAGAADYINPNSISGELLERYHREGLIEWRGLVQDMDPLFAEASIVCVPSYYMEGMPKVLLEAAAAGCAVVTTDLPGCREAMIANETGDLVPPQDAGALAKTLLALMHDRVRREAYGRAGRRLAADRFSIEAVVQRVMEVYEELAASGQKGRRGPSAAPVEPQGIESSEVSRR